jgi:hypothetical protein
LEEHPSFDPFVAPIADFPHKINFRVEELQEEDRKRHDALARFIARNRFAYPTKQSPSLFTCVNLPKPLLRVSVSETESLCPDIVVVNRDLKNAAAVAEIETQMTIDNERAKLWRKYSPLRDVNFYLYVPQSQLEDVRALIRFFHVRVTGIRIYSYNNFGQPTISVGRKAPHAST